MSDAIHETMKSGPGPGSFYPGDTYDTPDGVPHTWGDRLCFGGRWYFYWKIFDIIRIMGTLGKCGRLDRGNQVRWCSQILKLVEACGARIHLRGLDNLRAMKQQPAVLLGNHMSFLETVTFPAMIHSHMDLTFVIKPSLMKIPFFRYIMIAINAVVITRNNPRQDLQTVLEEGKKRLDAGQSVVIFPQGTRSAEFDPEQFNSIGIKLARRTGYPVIPFAVKTDFMQNGKYLRNMGPIDRRKDLWMEFAPARPVTGSGREQHQEIIDFIVDRLKTWRSEEEKQQESRTACKTEKR